jgi:formate dehydrogenase major subunit
MMPGTRPQRRLSEWRRATSGSRSRSSATIAHGVLRPATWDEAMDRAAGGFRQAIQRHGPTAYGCFSCSKATNEVNFAAQKLARAVVGSNNIDSCNRT